MWVERALFEEEREHGKKKNEVGRKNTTGRAPALHYKPAFIYIR